MAALQHYRKVHTRNHFERTPSKKNWLTCLSFFLRDAGARPLLVIGIVDAELTSTPSATANRLCGVPAFPHKALQSGGAADEAELLLHVDHERGVAYIVLSAAAGLLSRASSILAAHSDAAAHAWLTDRASERALTVLFHLCHLVLVVNAGHAPDLRLLRTLRIVATLKQNAHPAVTAALKPIASQLQPHRQNNPQTLPPVPALGVTFATCQHHRAADASALQAALESQMRKLLTSSKQLARCAGSGSGTLYSLFKEPGTLVHLEPPTHALLRPHTAGIADAEVDDIELFGSLLGLLTSPPLGALPTNGAFDATTADSPTTGLSAWMDTLNLAASTHAPSAAAAAAPLRKFVARLAEVATNGCCHQTPGGLLAAGPPPGGRNAPDAGRHLPSAYQWSLACSQLLDRVFCAERVDEPSSSRDAPARLPPAAAITKMLDAESAFSVARGQAALPAALDLYSRSLPPQYTRSVHESRVAAAELHVKAHVIGPAREATLARLRRECLGVWQAGRQLCDAVSLTGRACTFRVHMLPQAATEPPEGLAAASGLLRLGDRLVAVNNEPVRGHARATMALKSAAGDLLLQIVRGGDEHAGGDEFEIEVVLHKPRPTSKLGIVLSSQSKETGVPTITGLGLTNAGGTSDARSARPHSSTYNMLHACHCGRTQQTRNDPFSLTDALGAFDSPCCEEFPYLALPLLCGSGTPAGGAAKGSGAGVAPNAELLHQDGDVDERSAASTAEATGDDAAQTATRLVHGAVANGVASALDTKKIAEAEMHGTTARLTLLGLADTYTPGRGLQQDGFLPRMNMLAAASLKAAPSGCNSVAGSAKSGAAKESGVKASPRLGRRVPVGAEDGGAHGNGEAPVPNHKYDSKSAWGTSDVFLGYEYECAAGHRFLGSPATQPGSRGVGGTVLADIVGKDTPLCRSCNAEGCKEYAQLQRLYVRTSDVEHTALVLRPTIRFHAGRGTDASCPPRGGTIFAINTPVILPRNALVCLRLPYCYGTSPTHALITRAAARDPSLATEAVLAARWLCAEPVGSRGVPISGDDWSALGVAHWAVPDVPQEGEDKEELADVG